MHRSACYPIIPKLPAPSRHWLGAFVTAAAVPESSERCSSIQTSRRRSSPNRPQHRDDEYRELVERTGEFLTEIDKETQRNRATYTEVEESEADLERFDRWFTSIAARDYFHAPGRPRAEAALQQCRDALTAFEAAAPCRRHRNYTG